ncbi:MAG TPA: glycosyltransferase family 4 protein [Elusimicrobiota bacterium]|nr:glycosyltransferase family 4 protein [Elusimicrobiota bacterium]
MAETLKNRRLSVAMVSASFYPYIGGAEKQALELAAALESGGARVTVLTRRLRGLPAEETVRGVRVIRLRCLGQKGFFNAASFGFSLFFHLLNQSAFYDAFHAHLAGSPALAAAMAGRFLNKPVWVKLGGGRGVGELSGSAKTIPGRLKLRLLAWLKPRFIAVSPDLVEEAAVYLGRRVGVQVLPNGVDTARYRPVLAARKAELRRSLGWPQDGLGFVYAGRIAPEKRLPYFLEAWADALKKSPDSRAFIAFVGDGIEAARLKDIAAYERLQDRVFLAPPTDDVAPFYGASDVFVLPSISEGLSNALLEAMSSGLAVLASRVGGTPEAVTEGHNGLLFAPENAEEIRVQVKKFLDHPELAAQMGRESRGIALERYSLAEVAKRYEALYAEG